MSGCNYFQKLIDEADKSDLLSFEVNEHVGRCGDCERFANDRDGLRKLLASESRVSVPMNFDAMLKARLAAVKARRSFSPSSPSSPFSWLSAPGYLRLGAATAGLVIMIFAAQYAGLFSDQPNPSVQSKAAATVPPQSPPVLRTPQITTPAPVIASTAQRAHEYYSRNPRLVRSDVAARGRTAPDGYFSAEDGGVVLVRGRNGEMDVPMPTVSVGAQPLLYVSAGQRAVRSAGNSF
jgi:hypothetical protein